MNQFIIESSEDLKSYLINYDSSKNSVLSSPVPEICKQEPCMLGIDEAGRGPVLGPMVYGTCYCPVHRENDLKTLECADSKTLTEKKRETIFDKIGCEKDYIGWKIEIISPNIICNRMLQRQKYSLNQVSQDSAVGLIQKVLDDGVNLTEVYVDTVGMPEKYQEKLSQIFPQVKITVAKKADSLYTIVGAASICAKVSRDLAVKGWNLTEHFEVKADMSWGSGYPGDPDTKKFLREHIDPVFGFPHLVRFSWSTAEKLLEEHAVTIEWHEDEEIASINNTSITSFFKVSSSSENKAKKKHSFFIDRCLTNTVNI